MPDRLHRQCHRKDEHQFHLWRDHRCYGRKLRAGSVVVAEFTMVRQCDETQKPHFEHEWEREVKGRINSSSARVGPSGRTGRRRNLAIGP